jgi:phosphoribosylformylglycinamidine synthase PurS subunit
MSTYKYIIHTKHNDPRALHYMKEAQALGFRDLQRITIHDLFFIEGQLSQEELGQLALKLLTDPVTQSATWTEIPAAPSPLEPDSVILEVALRPGVTDPVAEQIVRAAHELGFNGVQRAATGQRFVIQSSSKDSKLLEKIAQRLLVNAVIQHWAIGDIEPSFP